MKKQTKRHTEEELIAEINRCHQEVTKALGTALRWAKEAGDYLRIAKRRCKHGSWEDWVRTNFKGSLALARDYQLISREWDTEISKLVTETPDLSINVALQHLRGIKTHGTEDKPRLGKPLNNEKLIGREPVFNAHTRAKEIANQLFKKLIHDVDGAVLAYVSDHIYDNVRIAFEPEITEDGEITRFRFVIESQTQEEFDAEFEQQQREMAERGFKVVR